jgi:periplasmic divalent cation tolerance protein
MKHYRSLISATSKEEAQTILKLLLNNKLVAGGLITSGLSNHWWKGKIDEEIYYNISAFTTDKHKEEIIKKVEEIHSDEVPGIVFFEIDDGNKSFLAWIEENTT